MRAEANADRKLWRLVFAHFATGLGLAALVDVNASLDWVQASVNALFTALIGSE